MAPKKRERSEVEYLRGLVRELKTEVRNLKRESGRSSKKIQNLEANLPEPDLQPTEKFTKIEPSRDLCAEPGCGGELELVDIGVKLLKICKECRSRITVKK